MIKKTLVYLNQDCFSQVDDTVLCYLSKEYHVVWFLIQEGKGQNRLSAESANGYAKKFGIDLRLRVQKGRARSLSTFKFYKSISTEINTIAPDLIYHCDRNPYWALCIQYFIKCKNIVLGVHDAKPHSYGCNVSKQLAVATVDYSFRVHKHFVTFSKGQYDVMLNYRKRESEMVGMSCKSFGVSSKYPKPITDGVDLLFFGTINLYKGLDDLIIAMEELNAEGICNLHLTIAGKGPYWDNCKRHIHTPSIFNQMIRFIDNSEIPDLMSSHHFLILPYRNATQSGPLVTAVAYSLPIIAPSYGCFIETYNDKSAFLYSSGELLNTLRIVSQINEEKYQEIRSECKHIKDSLSEERVANNYINYFNRLLSES